MRAVVLAFLFVPSMALADTLVLEDGQRFEGVVTERGDTVEIQLEFGTVGFERSEVKSIEREATPLHELERRRAALAYNDLSGTLALARWATERGLTHGARSLYRHALTLNADLEEAHRALGHKKHEGAWLDETDYLRATGHVNYGGEWVTKDEALALDAAADKRRAAREARATAEREARQREEAEAARRRAEDAAKNARASQWVGNYNWGWYGFGWVPGQLGQRPAVFPVPRAPGVLRRPVVPARPKPMVPPFRPAPPQRP